MILLLGENNLVENYAESTLKVDMKKDFMYCPEFKDHFLQFPKYIDIISNKNPSVVTSQDIEMIKLLLESNLEFKVYTVFKNGKVRRMSKEQAINAYECLGLDVRC